MELIISFTTTPDRIAHIEPMLQSLRDQGDFGQKIWLWLCHRYERSNLEMGPEDVPGFVTDYGVEVKFDNDYGSNTKLLPTLKEVQNPDSAIITVDDDTLYPKGWLEGLVRATEANPHRAYGYRGKLFKPKKSLVPWRSAIRYQNTETIILEKNAEPKRVDLLTGVWGICYRRSFFNDTYFNLSSCPPALHNDDIWVNGHLARSEIERICLPSKCTFQDIDMESVGIKRLWDSVNNGKGLNNKVLNYFRQDFDKAGLSS